MKRKYVADEHADNDLPPNLLANLAIQPSFRFPPALGNLKIQNANIMFGNYLDWQQIGQGAQAWIYLARQPKGSTPVVDVDDRGLTAHYPRSGDSSQTSNGKLIVFKIYKRNTTQQMIMGLQEVQAMRRLVKNGRIHRNIVAPVGDAMVSVSKESLRASCGFYPSYGFIFLPMEPVLGGGDLIDWLQGRQGGGDGDGVGDETTLEDEDDGQYEGEPNVEHEEDVPDELTWNDFLDMWTQVLQGLEWIHSCGLVHNDIKPGNILWTRTYGPVKSVGLSQQQMRSSENSPASPSSTMPTMGSRLGREAGLGINSGTSGIISTAASLNGFGTGIDDAAEARVGKRIKGRFEGESAPPSPASTALQHPTKPPSPSPRPESGLEPPSSPYQARSHNHSRPSHQLELHVKRQLDVQHAHHPRSKVTFKIADFGYACGVNGRCPGGTRFYRSPESITSPGLVTPASDIFSLGVVLMDMLNIGGCRENFYETPGEKAGPMLGNGSPAGNVHPGNSPTSLAREHAWHQHIQLLKSHPHLANISDMFDLDPANRPSATELLHRQKCGRGLLRNVVGWTPVPEEGVAGSPGAGQRGERGQPDAVMDKAKAKKSNRARRTRKKNGFTGPAILARIFDTVHEM